MFSSNYSVLQKQYFYVCTKAELVNESLIYYFSMYLKMKEVLNCKTTEETYCRQTNGRKKEICIE